MGRLPPQDLQWIWVELEWNDHTVSLLVYVGIALLTAGASGMEPLAIWEAGQEVAGLGWFGDLDCTEATSSCVACVSLLLAAALSVALALALWVSW